jgi:hypothetical protein
VANLFSSHSKEQAEAVWSKLAGKAGGDQLFRYEIQVDGQSVYRVRLGFFRDQEAAQAAGDALSNEAGLERPWVSRPNVSEVHRFERRTLSDLWTVNLSSTPDEAESQAVWAALSGASSALEGLQDSRAQGLSALSLYRYDTVVDDQKRFRIRLGFFGGAPAAEAAGRALVEAAGLSESRVGKPWAVRPASGEVLAHRRN